MTALAGTPVLDVPDQQVSRVGEHCVVRGQLQRPLAHSVALDERSGTELSSVAADIVAYGLAAGLSVSAVLVTVIILTTDKARSNGFGWMAGFVLSVSLVTAGLVLISSYFAPEGREPVLLAVLKLLLGVMLLYIAWHERPGRDRGEGSGGKLKALLAKLAQLTPRAAFSTGFFFVLLPKRLIITVLAGLTIGLAALTTGESIALAGLYVLLVAAPIYIMLGGFILAGDRSDAAATATKDWLLAHAHPLAFVVSLIFGLLFTVQALVQLAT